MYMNDVLKIITQKNNLVTVLPLVFMFVTVFLTRSDVLWFFVSAGLMFLLTGLLLYRKKLSKLSIAGYALIILSSIGLSAATILTLEKIELIKDPSHVTSCSVSPIVACSPVIGSEQATAIAGIPNPIFGIFGFACLLAAGMGILAGAKYAKREYWLTLLAGVTAGSIFCIWLINEALYEINALCLYCMSVWMVSFALFWIVLKFVIENKYLKINKSVDEFIVRNFAALLSSSIGIVVLLIFFRWSEYWTSLFN